MKLLPIIALLGLFASCGKEYIDKSVYTDKYIENPYTAPEAPEFALSFSDYGIQCDQPGPYAGYKNIQTFKRTNSVVRMELTTDDELLTEIVIEDGLEVVKVVPKTYMLVNLGWNTMIELKRTGEIIDGEIHENPGIIILNYNKKVGEIEFPEQISLQIVAENGKVRLEVEELSIDLGIDVIPENVVYCHPDGKFVEMVQILDRLEF